LWILYTPWERQTCTNTGHLSVFHRLYKEGPPIFVCLSIIQSVTPEPHTSAQCGQSVSPGTPITGTAICLPNMQITTVQLSTWMFLVQCTRVGTVICTLLTGTADSMWAAPDCATGKFLYETPDFWRLTRTSLTSLAVVQWLIRPSSHFHHQ